MAADTANQKVFVPLSGVLKLQDEIRRFEKSIEVKGDDPDAASLLRAHHVGLRFAAEALGLPIEVRHFMK